MTPRAWIGLAALVAVAAVVGWSRWQVNSLRADLAEARNEAFSCSVSLDAQNQAVDAWKRAADRRAQATAEALAKAGAQRRRADTLAASIYSLQLPEDECDALRTLVDAARGPVSLRP